jgi:hypothetical protein
VKHLFRLMVTSAAYRQSAQVTPSKLEKDPANRFLSRGPRFRMDAEMVRDYALKVSGLLNPKLGGPSVKPYQPDGVWEAVAMPESNTKRYERDKGDSLYRRSLYTFWKRAAPPALMDVFNAPSRETCSVRRERTNTPLQALATLNDIQFIEAARILAQCTFEIEFDVPLDQLVLVEIAGVFGELAVARARVLELHREAKRVQDLADAEVGTRAVQEVFVGGKEWPAQIVVAKLDALAEVEAGIDPVERVEGRDRGRGKIAHVPGGIGFGMRSVALRLDGVGSRRRGRRGRRRSVGFGVEHHRG